MGWKIELSGGADKALSKLDSQVSHRILRFLHDRLARMDDPRQLGKPLKGSRLGHFWRYRVGHYRIIADVQDEVLTVLIVRIGHRRHVYR